MSSIGDRPPVSPPEIIQFLSDADRPTVAATAQSPNPLSDAAPPSDGAAGASAVPRGVSLARRAGGGSMKAQQAAAAARAAGTLDFIVDPNAAHSLLRPETMESLFYLWRLTHDPKYRLWGWNIFRALHTFARVPSGGYSGLRDVRRTDTPYDTPSYVIGRDGTRDTVTHSDSEAATDSASAPASSSSSEGGSGADTATGAFQGVDQARTPARSHWDNWNDKMESFYLAETCKYLYLLWSDDNVIPITEWVFNTEVRRISHICLY